jgi:hypothetical protein
MEHKVFKGMENTFNLNPIILFETFKNNYSGSYDILTKFGYNITKIKNNDYVAIKI